MINYKHLRYFWTVAKEGSIARASERLHLTPQTISGQLSLLEEQLGEALFKKVGRQLELTDTGRLVQSYADEIFALGGELEAVLRNLPPDRRLLRRLAPGDKGDSHPSEDGEMGDTTCGDDGRLPLVLLLLFLRSDRLSRFLLLILLAELGVTGSAVVLL